MPTEAARGVFLLYVLTAATGAQLIPRLVQSRANVSDARLDTLSEQGTQ
jgi:hypothetical protein